MERLEKFIMKINLMLVAGVNVILGILSFVLVGIVALNVFFRYCLKDPLFWVTELACYLLVYLVFFSAAVALYRGEHVGFQLNFTKLFPGASQVIGMMIIAAHYFFISALITVGGKLSLDNMGSFTGTLSLPMGAVYLAAPLSGIIMLFLYTEVVIGKRRGK